jgi:hypothetical protein
MIRARLFKRKQADTVCYCRPQLQSRFPKLQAPSSALPVTGSVFHFRAGHHRGDTVVRAVRMLVYCPKGDVTWRLAP